MNRNYEMFRNNVINAIHESGIEFGATYYILKDVLNEVERAYSNSIRQEIEAEAQQASDAESESAQGSEDLNE